MSSYSKKDIEWMLRRVHLDLDDAQKKVRDLMEIVMALPIPETVADGPACPTCGPLRAVTNQRLLDEHLENVHGVRNEAA